MGTERVNANTEIAEVFDRHRSSLLGLAILLTGSRAVAEEVVQDAFANAIPRWENIEDPEHYLRRAIVNQTRTLGRRATLFRAIPLRPERVTGEPELDETWHHLRRLPQRQRTAIVLRIHLDLSDAEIADRLECPEATVRSLIFRGLARIRKDLS